MGRHNSTHALEGALTAQAALHVVGKHICTTHKQRRLTLKYRALQGLHVASVGERNIATMYS